MEIMKFRKFINYYFLGESVKEMELNRILDKVGNKTGLTDREKSFLNLYQDTTDDDMRDLMYLSKNSACNIIKGLLEKGKKVICDLHDRNGKIGLRITDIDNNFEDDTCVVTMKDETHKLEDRFLYNIIYDCNKDIYSLIEQDEFFEKIPVNDED